MIKLAYEAEGIKVLKNNDDYCIIDTNRMPPSHEIGWRYGLRAWSQLQAERAFGNCKGTGLTIRLSQSEIAAQFIKND
jgi:hypothetical protein